MSQPMSQPMNQPSIQPSIQPWNQPGNQPSNHRLNVHHFQQILAALYVAMGKKLGLPMRSLNFRRILRFHAVYWRREEQTGQSQ
mmetsp:Transcript_13751/g.20272  ORF Transcript_13751/g.20272 Transcript_13751/m.20272 type:complete len:84 (-) Transcript_13751:34-285(-)